MLSEICTINVAEDAHPQNILIAPRRKSGKRVYTFASAGCFLELNPADGDTHRDSESEHYK